MRKYLVTYTKDNAEYYGEAKGPNMKGLKAYMENDGCTNVKVYDANKWHFCKYCGEITPSNYEDLLCEECREVFGHTLYSEL